MALLVLIETIMPLLKTSFTLLLTASAVSMPFLPIPSAAAQTAPASTARLVGTVTAINGSTISLKSDAGVVATVSVSETTRMVRTAPGEKTLTGATAIHLQDLAVGDRVLIRATPGSTENTYTAQAVIAMKQGDIAQKQQQERQEWQLHSVGGIAKSVDTASGTIVIASGARTVTIHAGTPTIVRRYAPDSVKFDDAKLATLDQIKPGDQVRARGQRSADGMELTADEIVAGSFRNIAATVDSVDAAAQTVTVTDAATKKPVVVKFTADSQLHKLAPEMAQAIAGRLRGAGAENVSAQAGAAPANPPANHGAAGNQGAPEQGRQRGGDLSQLIQRAPVIQLSDLHHGDAVMIVSTEGTPTAATAVTLLAGVEPMLQASTKASQSLFSSSWSLNGGGDAGGAAQQ